MCNIFTNFFYPLTNKSLISSLYNSNILALTMNYTPGVPLIDLNIWSKVLGIIPLYSGTLIYPYYKIIILNK